MKKQTQVALAVGAGYVLGRRHKLRLALMVGTAAMTGGFGGLAGELLGRGTKGLGTTAALGKVTPELGGVAQMVRGTLLDAGKAAALTAVRSRVDRVSDKLHNQAELLRQPRSDDPGAEPEEFEEDDTSDYEASDEPVDEYNDAEAQGYEEDDELEASEDSYEETDDGEEHLSDAEEPEPMPSVSRAAGQRRPSTRSPVQRTRR